MTDSVAHLFVYGTLRPGDVRWHFLQPFVTDEGWPDTIEGSLFDTGLGYPAAIIDERATPGETITGRTYPLLDASRKQALDVLDREEATVAGLYRRVVVVTHTGITAFTYEYGDGLQLSPIPSGDWLQPR